MLTPINWQTLSLVEKKETLSRPKQAHSFKNQVEAIIHAVKTRGDKALFAFSREFDRVDLQDLRVPIDTINSAEISSKAMNALLQAIETLRIYNQAIMPLAKEIETAKGIKIERIYRPINRVGLYVPGGNNTPLISSVLMQAIPALVAVS
ncbi:MAG: histidinol dehydrogenase [Tatlockia sp.]|nr:histidinol dehydrogenase [Tatlockia sp.]